MTSPTTFAASATPNLSSYHREHEKFYAFDPIEKALALHRASQVLLSLVDRWSTVQPAPLHTNNPYLEAVDLNETSTIQQNGILFLEQQGEPPEIKRPDQRHVATRRRGVMKRYWILSRLPVQSRDD